MPVCGNGHEVPVGAKFRPECGAALAQSSPVEPTRQRATTPAKPVAPAKPNKPWAFLVGFLALVLIIGVSVAALLATGDTSGRQRPALAHPRPRPATASYSNQDKPPPRPLVPLVPAIEAH